MIKTIVTIQRESENVEWYIPDEKYKNLINDYINKKVILSRITENVNENKKIITTIFLDIESFEEYRNDEDIKKFILESSNYYSLSKFILSSEEYVTD